MKTAIFSLIGMILTIVYMVFFSSQPWTTLLFLPLSWIVAVWIMHGLSRAYIVTLFVGIMFDLHLFNFGLMTVIILVALSLTYFLHISVISSTNAASTLSLGMILPLIVYTLLWISSGITNGFQYYHVSWSLLFLALISSLILSLLMYGYSWLIRQITNS